VTLCLSCSSLGADGYRPKLLISKHPSRYDFAGEELKFRLYWTIFHVADSSSKVTPLKGGRLKLWGKISTAGVASWFKKISDEGYSIWNLKTLTPEKTYLFQYEGHYQRERVYTYDLKKRVVKYEKINPKKHKVEVKYIKIPFIPFEDIVTSTYFFRKYGRFKVGAETVFPLFAGGRFQNVSFKVVAKEKVETLFGKIEAYKVIPSNNLSPEGAFERKGKVVMWFSADERHLPIKVEAEVAIGSVSAVLVDAKGRGFDLRKEYEKVRKRNFLQQILSGEVGGD